MRVFPQSSPEDYWDVEPLLNRMLFFWSDVRNPHEVQPAFKTRYRTGTGSNKGIYLWTAIKNWETVGQFLLLFACKHTEKKSEVLLVKQLTMGLTAFLTVVW